MVRASTIWPLTEHFFNSHDLTNTREKLQGEESRLTHWRTGLGQGSLQSRCSRVRGLTANVKRRNLLRRTGLSRAAPDLMDSQICQKKEKHQSRCQGLLPPRHTWSCPAASPSCPQAQHHSSWAVMCVTTHSAPFTLPLPQPHSLQTEESQRTQKPPLSGAQHQRRQPACLRLRYFLQQIFTYSQLQSKHIGATEIGDTVPTLKKLTGCERARRQCLYTTRQQVPSQEGGQFLGGALTSAKDTGGKGAREVLQRQ